MSSLAERSATDHRDEAGAAKVAFVDGMRILIVGAGAIGSVYGAKLLEMGPTD